MKTQHSFGRCDAYLKDLLPVVGAVYSTRDREDGRRLSGTRRAIEQQVR